MRSTACEDVSALIDREAIGWTEAERLRVEQHLGECEECMETLNVSRFVRDTLKDASGELSEAARGRAIKNALKVDVRAVRVPHAPRGMRGWQAGLALAAAAALVIWLVRTEEPQVATHSAPRPATTAVASAPAKATEQAPAETRVVESQGRESHVFAHATVQFAADTRARFDAATYTLTLERGAIDLDVDPSKHTPFIVVTEHFRVEVLGTRFSVTPDEVRVEQGRVRVVGLTGVVLASELGAGQSYTFNAEEPAKPSKPAKVVATADASQLLAQARSAIARDDKARARTLIQQAERARPDRTERAEAGTLRAELALLERNNASALRLYREVGKHYAELPAGENASYAAAQLALKVAPDKARVMLEDYLSRYPHGRFVDEAQKRLTRLGAR